MKELAEVLQFQLKMFVKNVFLFLWLVSKFLLRIDGSLFLKQNPKFLLLILINIIP